MPRYTRIEHRDANSVTVSMPSAIRFWWMTPFLFGPIAVGLAIFGGIILGIVPMVYQANGWTPPYWTPVPMLLLLAVAVGLTVALWRVVFPRLRITATKDVIIFNGRRFDRRHHKGLRIGYAAVKDSGVTFDLSDRQFGFTTVRVTYGRWGEDMKHMLRSYRAPEYIVWFNELAAEVGKAEPREHDPAQGRKKATF